MRKIFEFKVFDVVNNPDNQEFLKKVKDQNPDLYGRFVSLIGNKGLAVAKEKYNEYDPEWIKNRFRVKKKEKKKEDKKQREQDILKKWETEINMINDILKTSPLKKEILNFINNDENLSRYLRSCYAKKQYTNLFSKELKHPIQFDKKMDGPRQLTILTIDKLEFIDIPFGDTTISGILNGDEQSRHKYLEIDQLIHFGTNEVYYSILPSLKTEDYGYTEEYGYGRISFDKGKDDNFIFERNVLINSLKKYHLDKEGLLQSLKNFSHILSDEFYDEYKMRKDAKKYNL